MSRKKSRRTLQDGSRSSSVKEDCDDLERFSILVQKTCDDRLCPFYPAIFGYAIEDGQPICIRRPSIVCSFTVHAFIDQDATLKLLEGKSSERIDTGMFFATIHALVQMQHLKSLKLDYCNLTHTHLDILSDNLKSASGLIELSLTGNPNATQNFYRLIRSGVKVLCLKFCHIKRKGLKKIAEEYLQNPAEPPQLVHLDLGHNLIFDEGCDDIATILRCDCTLRSLNLTDCCIREEGFAKLMSSFTKFSLTHEEVMVRRQLRLDLFQSGRDVKHRFVEALPESGEIWCEGNDTLERLNMSYNHLTQSSLDLLLKVVMLQPKGLKNVVLDGNVEGSAVKQTIEELLVSKMLTSQSKTSSKSVRSSLKKRKSSSASSKDRTSTSALGIP